MAPMPELVRSLLAVDAASPVAVFRWMWQARGWEGMLEREQCPESPDRWAFHIFDAAEERLLEDAARFPDDLLEQRREVYQRVNKARDGHGWPNQPPADPWQPLAPWHTYSPLYHYPDQAVQAFESAYKKVRGYLERMIEDAGNPPPSFAPFVKEAELRPSQKARVRAALERVDKAAPVARRLECLAVLLAQAELMGMWDRIAAIERAEAEDKVWDEPQDAAWDLYTIYLRAKPTPLSTLVNIVSPPGPGVPDDMFARQVVALRVDYQLVVRPGLAACYWQTEAYYRDTFNRNQPIAPWMCPYCLGTIAPERQPKARTCGAQDCQAEYEKDRLWWSRHREEARPLLRQRLGDAAVADLHPAAARSYCRQLGIAVSDRRGRPKKQPPSAFA